MNDNNIVNTYVKKISYNAGSPLDFMRTFAVKNNIPIIGDETLRYIEFIISIIQPKKILEVGTAIGYSTSAMLLKSKAEITSIEILEDSHNLARENLKTLGLNHRANLILGDADVELERLIQEKCKFDFAFIDGPKSHYLKHLISIDKMMDAGSTIIFDDVLYLGLVAGKRSTKRNNTIRHAMIEFMDYCFNNKNYMPSLIQVEDGILNLLKL